MKLQKLSKLAILFLLFFVIQGFQINNAQATSSWTQTDWSGGDGQGDWSDDTKFNAEAGEGTYLQNGNLRMKINADVVVGQEDFVSGDVNQGGAVSSNTLYMPFGAFFAEDKMLICDGQNNRVLIYNTIPTENNAEADVVIGQSNFTDNTANQGGTPSANTLRAPTTPFVDKNGKLFVPDNMNNRVLIYNTIPTENNTSADVVIGQADFTENGINQSGSVSASTLYRPYTVYSDGERLFVTDRYNNRVLIYNSIPTTNNASADIVIGQQDFVSGVEDQGGTVSASTLQHPDGLRVVGGKIIVSDNQNHRVLIYNQIPTSNNASADVVFGQPDFISDDYNQGGDPNGYNYYGPQPLHIDGDRLFVSDWSNSRTFIYNTIPTINGVAADEVLGQADFLGYAQNQGGTPNSNTLAWPNDSNGNDNIVAISEHANHRILIFNKTKVQSTLISSTYKTTEEQDFGPVSWEANTTQYSDIKVETSVDEGITWAEVENGDSHVGRGTSLTYKVTLISKDGLSTPTFKEISFGQQTKTNSGLLTRFRLNKKLKDLTENKKLYINKHKPTIQGENIKLKNGKIKVYKNKTKIKEIDVDENGEYNGKLKLKHNKTYSLKIKYQDSHGTTLDTEKFKIKVDSEDPIFTDFPKNNQYKQRGKQLYWTATDNDKIKKFKVYFNGKNTKTKESTFTVPQNTLPGTHTFTVKVYDKAGNSTKKSVLVRVW